MISSSLLQIDSATGDISLANPSGLVGIQQFNLNVEVTDNLETDMASVTIDVDESVPIVSISTLH